MARLHTGVVVFINEKRFDDDQNLVHEWPHQLVQLVQDPVDDLHVRFTVQHPDPEQRPC